MASSSIYDDDRISISSSDIPTYLVGGGILVLLLFGGQALLQFSQLFNTVYDESKTDKSTLQFMKLVHFKSLDIVISVITWIIFGYAFAYGTGTTTFSGNSQYGTDSINESSSYSLWFYALSTLILSVGVLSSSISTIMPNCVGYSIVAIFYCVVIFPILHHWAWSYNGMFSAYRSANKDYLVGGCGILDSAGSAVVYMASGMSSLAFFIGYSRSSGDATAVSPTATTSTSATARNKKNEAIDKLTSYPPHSSVVSLFFGILLNWIGSIGLHCINNLPINFDTAKSTIGKRCATTSLAACIASIISFAYFERYKQYYCTSKVISVHDESSKSQSMKHATLPHIYSSTLSCFIAMCANSSACELEGAFVIGVLSVLVYIFVLHLCKSLHLHDGYTTALVYALNGAAGLIYAGFLTSIEGYRLTLPSLYEDNNGNVISESRAEHCAGVFYGGSGSQLGVNICFILAILTWTVVPMHLLSMLLRKVDKGITRIKEALSGLVDQEETKKGDSFSKEISEIRERRRTNSLIEMQQKLTTSRMHNSTEADKFLSLHGYSYDLCMILPVHAVKETHRKKKVDVDDADEAEARDTIIDDVDTCDEVCIESLQIIKSLQMHGLQTYQYYSVQNDEICVKIRADVERIQTQADIEEIKMPLDEEYLRTEAASGYIGMKDNERVFVNPFTIADGREYTKIRAYQYIHAPYDGNLPAKDKLYVNAPGLTHPFHSIVRLKLMDRMIRGAGAGCCNLQMLQLQQQGKVLAYFPLHNTEEKRKLKDAWLSCAVMPWEQPNDMIRAYFGERVSLYFMFLSHYITWLIPLAIGGVVVSLQAILLVGNHGSLPNVYKYMISIPIFSFMITIWSCIFLLHWKNKEEFHAVKWGMMDAEEDEVERPGFIGYSQHCYLTGQMLKQYPKRLKRQRIYFATLIINLFLCVIIGIVTLIFYLKYTVKHGNASDSDKESSTYLLDFANAMQIQFFSAAYSVVAVKLCNLENNRTETEYRDSLILKLFAFNFINSYIPLCYIAFVKPAVNDDCYMNSCMTELTKTLFILHITKTISSNLSTVLGPKIRNYLRKLKEADKKTNNRLSEPELQYIMEKYDDNCTQDYNEISVQFGYMTLFIAATPYAALISLLANLLEMRSDGGKLMKDYRRPFPNDAEDIGTWYTIFQIVSFISIFSNAGLIFYTLPLFDSSSIYERLWYSFCFVVFSIFVRYHISNYLSSDAAEIQGKRQSHLINKILHRVPDEDVVEDEKKIYDRIQLQDKLKIKINDHDEN